MASPIVARNYAQTLLALAQKHGGPAAIDEYARSLDEVVDLLSREPRVREFLETPRIGVDAKKQALVASLQGRAPEMFVRFLLVVVEKRRQALLVEIAAAYRDLVDELMNRVRAEITLAQEPDEQLRAEIVRSLEQQFGKTVLPSFRVDPALVGGVVVRVGDQIFDGSLRRQLSRLRRRLYKVNMPHAAA